MNTHDNQDCRHLHHVGEASFLLKFNTKMQVASWFIGEGDQRRPGCLSITKFKAAEAVRGICPPLRPATLSWGHLAWGPLPSFSRKWLRSPSPPIFISTPNLGSKSTRFCSPMPSYGQINIYNIKIYDARQNLLFGEHLVRPSYVRNTVFAVTRLLSWHQNSK